MKKIRRIFILLICFLLLFSSASCKDASTPKTLYPEGRWVDIDKNSRMRTVSDELTKGRVVIKMELDFSDMTLSDFSHIVFSKSEVGRPDVEMDMEETRALNTEDIFSVKKGEVYMVFSDNSIYQPTEGSSIYTLDIDGYSFIFMYGDPHNVKND